jgi:hypothetical protein
MMVFLCSFCSADLMTCGSNLGIADSQNKVRLSAFLVFSLGGLK